MNDHGENVEIVRTIIMLGRNLCMKVIAEGIETHEQLRQLKALECDEGQGYYFSRPLPSDELQRLLEGEFAFAAEHTRPGQSALPSQTRVA